MKLIIDAYNVLKLRANRDISEKERSHFIYQLNKYADCKKHEIVCVFDAGGLGFLHAEQHAKVKVVYTGVHKTADEYICETIEQVSHPDNVVIITTDRAICSCATHANIITVDSSVFIHYLYASGKPSQVFKSVAPQGIRKKSGTPSSPVDQLMYEMCDSVEEDRPYIASPQNTNKLSSGNKLSRMEKRLQRIMDKL